MLDWSGNMTSEKERKRIVLSEIDDDSALAASMTISDLEHLRINQCIEQAWDMDNTPEQVDDQFVQPPSYENASVLAGISLTLDPTLLYEKLAEKVTRGKFSESIARLMGTARFLIIQTVLVIIWITLNVLFLALQWDKYPFILLNLMFSVQAAYAAPLILLSQNRQELRDRRQAETDRAVSVGDAQTQR